MIIKPKFIYECDNPVSFDLNFRKEAYTGQHRFDDAQQLIEFLLNINWLATRLLSRQPVGLVNYRLGACLEFEIGGYQNQSTIQWGPHFLVGTTVQNGKVFTPTDDLMETIPEYKIARTYAWCDVDLTPYDAVISPSLMQIWPTVHPGRNVLKRFIENVTVQQFIVQTRQGGR